MSDMLVGAGANERTRLFRYLSAAWYDGVPHFQRASHLCVCEWCKRTYQQHPGSAQWPFLHVLCDSRLVKL